jgi:hypothetical protein
MPLYFGTVAETCPNSRDQLPADRRWHLNRTAFSSTKKVSEKDPLEDISTVVNLTRSIVTDITKPRTINNVYNPKFTPVSGVAKDKFKLKTPRWVEQPKKRVRKQYKYFGERSDGSADHDTWVIMERIVRMVWYDSVWKTYLKWEYGDKGEGELVKPGTTQTRSDRASDPPGPGDPVEQPPPE